MEEALVIEALKFIKKGKIFDLGMEINRRIPSAKAGQFQFDMLFSNTPENYKKFLKNIENNSEASFSQEVVIGPTHISTHIDALCHIQYNDEIYGNNAAKDIRTDLGWEKFGAEKIPPIIGRGILLDIVKYKGLKKLKSDYEISLQDIKDCLGKNNLKIRKSDIVCLRTGKIKDFYNSDYLIKGPGVSIEAAQWLGDKVIKALGIDYANIDRSPMSNFNNCAHMQLLYKRGIYIIENLNLELLSKAGILEFFLFCSAPKITGASASWVRPVAIV
jgi:kynurenine formamidase